jgi:hypothetical protein
MGVSGRVTIIISRGSGEEPPKPRSAPNDASIARDIQNSRAAIMSTFPRRVWGLRKVKNVYVDFFSVNALIQTGFTVQRTQKWSKYR